MFRHVKNSSAVAGDSKAKYSYENVEELFLIFLYIMKANSKLRAICFHLW